jgi:penicillin-binding protein 2
MRFFPPDVRQRRTLGALFAIAFTIVLLLTAFFHTQIRSGEQYALRAEENRLRPVVMPAPRGTLVDRNGETVATSVPGYRVLLLPGEREAVQRTLRELAPFLGLAGQDIERLLRERSARPHDLLTVGEGVAFAQAAAIEERRTSFPNVLVLERPRRHYPAGPAVGHLVGYVAEISAQELELPRFKESGYRQGRWIGKAGIEREYELLLSGEDGARFVEVDAMGRIINPRSTVEAVPPVPGEALRLTIDLDLQRYIHEIFPDTMKGALVAMIPSTGEILAMYSNPPVDPNDFVGGIPLRLWRVLSQDTAKPLLNRAVAALYPPGSTWKLATAAVGLGKDLVEASTRMPIPCTGGMTYAGRYWRCWYAPGHGSLDLVGAIEHSCNVYFYQLGLQIGLQELIRQGTRMGFSSETGLDFPSERAGEFPTGLDWYEKRFGYEPKTSEVLSLAIGQGPNAQSVLKMAHFYSAIAGDGTAPEPFLAYVQRDEREEVVIDLDLSDEDLRAMWEGLRRVVAEGTARLSALERWQLYGKTGTSQTPHGDDHGWFTGFAGRPGEPPEVVVAVVVEHGLHGSDVAPLAAKAAEFYLDKKHGLAFDPEPTLCERIGAC